MWYAILGIVALFSASAAIYTYTKTRKTLERADKMLDEAISGTFTEKNFSEDELSRLESKLYRYLSKGETSLNRINEEKDRIKTLISDISHQTKTPIANILLYAQLLEERADGETRELVDKISEQSEKLNFLITSLVKLSRLENGIVQVYPSKNRVQDMIAEVLREFEAKAADKGVALSLGCGTKAEESFEGIYDPKWTGEALGNIVDNAIKYTNPGGKVTISTVEYEMFVRIEVKDNGIGIAEAEQAQVFGRFYRSQEVSGEKGAGIGLYLAREILSKEGGYIKLEAKPGKGSCFSVFLPKQGVSDKEQ